MTVLGGRGGGVPTSRGLGSLRQELLAFVELLAVSGLAFAQPMFDVLNKNSEIFVSRHATRSDVVLLTLAVLLGPPLLWYAIEVVVSLIGARVRNAVHLLGLGLGMLVFFVEVVKHGTDLGEPAVVALAVVGAGLFVLLIVRVAPARSWLRFVAIAAPLFAALFLFTSSVHTVVFGGKDAAIAHVRVQRPHRVVWLVFDEFPETSLLDGTGRVDAQLFPNFARLAATSNWYRNSTTIAPFTLAAVPGMLSGTVPDDVEAPAVPANYPDTVFTLLGGSYDVNAFETLTVLCPNQVCRDPRHLSPAKHSLGGLGTDALDLWRDFASPRRAKPGLDIVRGVLSYDTDPAGTTRRFVDSLAPSRRPRLDFLHVLLPHWPWHYVKSLQDNGSIGNPPGLAYDRWSSAWAARSGRAQHLLQVQATDTLLGMLMDKLEAIGAWDDTLLVVTADHGVGFAKHEPARGLGATDAPDLAWTPLFFKLPGQTAAKVDDRLARTTDVLPTVADVLGVRIPWSTSGRSLLGTPRPNGAFPMLHWKIDATNPRGRSNTIDGVAGFPKVLAGRAAAPAADAGTRLYRVGPYGGLVGRPASGLRGTGRSEHRFTISNPGRFANVDPVAPVAPFLWVSGVAPPRTAGVPVAIVVNGVVAATTRTVSGGDGPSSWWAPLPPQYFHAGSNDVEVDEIRGPPTAPTLVPGAP
jgi:hypothetical protein